VVELDVKFNVEPTQSGPLLEIVGVAGGTGSEMINGPTTFDLHTPNVTLIAE
jgi:hypothetical protein